MNPLIMMLGGGLGGPDKLYSSMKFEFTEMQSKLWEAFEKELIVYLSEFMKLLIEVVGDDKDQYQLFFATLFNMMHLNLNSIKLNKMKVAEG